MENSNSESVCVEPSRRSVPHLDIQKLQRDILAIICGDGTDSVASTSTTQMVDEETVPVKTSALCEDKPNTNSDQVGDVVTAIPVSVIVSTNDITNVPHIHEEDDGYEFIRPSSSIFEVDSSEATKNDGDMNKVNSEECFVVGPKNSKKDSANILHDDSAGYVESAGMECDDGCSDAIEPGNNIMDDLNDSTNEPPEDLDADFNPSSSTKVFYVHIVKDIGRVIRITERDSYGQIFENNFGIPEQCQRFKLRLRYNKDNVRQKLSMTVQPSNFKNLAGVVPQPSTSTSLAPSSRLVAGRQVGPSCSKSNEGSSMDESGSTQTSVCNEKNKKKRVKCREPDCQKYFNCGGAAKIHYDSFHLRMTYKCTLCASQFRVVTLAYKHVKEVHPEEHNKAIRKKNLITEIPGV